MSQYTIYDFSESLARTSIKPSDIQQVVAAWGTSGDYSEWEGGFILSLKDGRFAYIWGWCDTSGWGCQDGAEVEFTQIQPPLEIKRGVPMHMTGYLERISGDDKSKWDHKWDQDPVDLNKWIAKGGDPNNAW